MDAGWSGIRADCAAWFLTRYADGGSARGDGPAVGAVVEAEVEEAVEVDGGGSGRMPPPSGTTWWELEAFASSSLSSSLSRPWAVPAIVL